MKFSILVITFVCTICVVKCDDPPKDPPQKFVFSYPKRKTWFEAISACRKISPENTYELATILSIDDQKAVENLFKTKKTPKRFKTFKDQIWIGANKMFDTSSDFAWFPSNNDLGFTNWDENEPNNKDDNEKCLALRNRVDTALVWNDSECSNKFYYMCKVKDVDAGADDLASV